MTTSDSVFAQPRQLNDKPETQDPLVSIIIPFRNTERFLQDAIDSVLAQSYDNWELLLVDDGSSDRSREIALQCASQHPQKIRLLEHDGRRNCGVSASRNLGLRQATGEYACFLDADDVFLPRKLERQCAILKSNPEAVVVSGAFQYWYSWTGIESDARRDFTVHLAVEANRLYRPPELLIHNLRANGRKPGTSSIMMRRERLPIDVCDESFIGLGDDQVFWAKLSLHVPVFVTNECLFKYRQHSDSLCAVALRGGDDLVAWQRFLSWLEGYLTSEEISTTEVWDALKRCQKSIALQIRFASMKLLYRRLLPIRTRYWLRDRLIKMRSVRQH
jgi:glycosyltransferase involved in cell wall biosynthesis